MKKLLYLFVFLFWSGLVAQEQDSVAVEVINFRGDLQLGEAFSVAKTSITFLKVISDSRCPRQVTCIWPGEAKILVGINENGKYSEKELKITGGTGAPLLNIQNLSVDALNLFPYPETAENIAPEAYNIRYSISAPVEN